MSVCVKPGCEQPEDYHLHLPASECEPCYGPQDHHEFQPGPWTVQAGRGLVRDGQVRFNLASVELPPGSPTRYALPPVELDALAHRIADLLNGAGA